jgi:alanine racemase
LKRYRPTYVEVDLDAIRHNVSALKPAEGELMAVVKANAYGHGDVEVARAALDAGATWLAVALVEEGLHLREAGIDAQVLMLSEFPPGSEADALQADLTPTVYTDEGIDRLAAVAADVDGAVGVHVKLDTGMHRVGLYPPDDVVDFVRRVLDSGLAFEGLWTHFARSDDDAVTTLDQLKLFLQLTKDCLAAGYQPEFVHASNSAATMLLPEAHLDIVRPGIAIYGVEPASGLAERFRLEPALTWRSAVTMSRRLPAGEAISYGHRYKLERDSTIATVPVGYADGYSRRLTDHAEVLIRGVRRPVAGAVTMDQILVDCGDDDVAAGEEVVLLGLQGDEFVSAEELGAISGTIGYEIVTGISERVPREYVGR